MMTFQICKIEDLHSYVGYLDKIFAAKDKKVKQIRYMILTVYNEKTSQLLRREFFKT